MTIDHALPSATPTESVYTVVKTPRSQAVRVNNAASLQTAHKTRHHRPFGLELFPFLVRLALLLIVVAIAMCVWGQILVFTNFYNLDLKVTLSAWWGVPKAQALVGGGTPIANAQGHSELVRPTFVLLFFALPLLVSLLLVEFLRGVNARRITSSYVLALARVLRRKPSAGSLVSPFSYGELLFLVGFLIGGNVLAFYYGFDRRLTRAKQNAATAKKHDIELDEYIDMVAVTLGFNCIYNMVFLFLPATRNAAWIEFLSISYANAIKYHRWLGVVTVLTALAHCVSFFWLWVREGTWREQALPCFDCALRERKGKQVWMNIFGELALLCFLAIGITSIPFVRRKFYNVFYYVHHVFGLAVVFAVLHWAPIIWWIYPTFVLYLANRTISSSNAFAPVEVSEFTLVGERIVKIVLARSLTRSGDYKLGQFVYLNIPAISKLQWHPFTIASSPATHARTLTVLVKALGDWTSDLAQYAEDCKQRNESPRVFVDGYYGASLECYREYSTLCLIGGGIGVTPLVAILEDIAATLALSNAPLAQTVHFVFSFRELALLEEILPLLMRIRECDPLECFFKLHLSLTQEPPSEALDQPIGATTTKNHILPTFPVSRAGRSKSRVAGTPKSSSLQPFVEPLRTRGVRSLAYIAVFSVSFALVVMLEFGTGKIKGAGRDNLWMLQQFVEITALVVSALVVVAAFIVVERYYFQRRTSVVAAAKSVNAKNPREDYDVATSVSHNPSAISSITHPGVGQLHTYRDVVNELDVVLGRRHQIADVLKQITEAHDTSALTPRNNKSVASAIGVFVSGPSALVDVTERAVAALGASRFDVHEEEFEM